MPAKMRFFGLRDIGSNGQTRTIYSPGLGDLVFAGSKLERLLFHAAGFTPASQAFGRR